MFFVVGENKIEVSLLLMWLNIEKYMSCNKVAGKCSQIIKKLIRTLKVYGQYKYFQLLGEL